MSGRNLPNAVLYKQKYYQRLFLLSLLEAIMIGQKHLVWPGVCVLALFFLTWQPFPCLAAFVNDGPVASVSMKEQGGEIPAFYGQTFAAGSIKGVGAMGYGAPAPASPPRPTYGNTPGDYQRGYEGHRPGLDPWHREADFKARNYQLRYGPQPQIASPPPGVSVPGGPEPGLPTLPKPPLPGDRDMPADKPEPVKR